MTEALIALVLGSFLGRLLAIRTSWPRWRGLIGLLIATALALILGMDAAVIVPAAVGAGTAFYWNIA